MAGSGSRFATAGYKDPKPLIQIGRQRMIEWVVNNLTPPPGLDLRFIFIVQSKHLQNFQLQELLSFNQSNVIVPIDHLTDGAASTIALASEFIDNDDHLIIANSDQFVDIRIDDFYRACLKGADGTIMTFLAQSKKWSYVALDDNELVTLVREKEPISNYATVGIYHFRKGSDFVTGVREMKTKRLTVNGEYYVAPVYNELIATGAKIGHFMIKREQMHGLGTPDDLDEFLASAAFKRFNNLKP